jgi:SRSO17 transposase
VRQYCGQLGKQDNWQAVVSLSVANHHGSLPVAQRRAKAGVPPDTVEPLAKPR